MPPSPEPIFYNPRRDTVLLYNQEGRPVLVQPHENKGQYADGVYEVHGEHWRQFATSGVLVEFRPTPVPVAAPVAPTVQSPAVNSNPATAPALGVDQSAGTVPTGAPGAPADAGGNNPGDGDPGASDVGGDGDSDDDAGDDEPEDTEEGAEDDAAAARSEAPKPARRLGVKPNLRKR